MKEFAAVFLALSLGACAVAEESVRIVMATDEGSIEIDLYTEAAPITAGNFLKLTDNGDLDGGSFYRVVTYENDRGAPKIEVIQGGRGNAAAGEIEAIDHENTDRTGILHTDGVISMARDGVGTATSEFFICIGDQPGLDYGQSRNADGQGFAAFGKVVSGMDVVRRIQGLPADAASYSEYTKGQILASPVVITSVRRAE